EVSRAASKRRILIVIQCDAQHTTVPGERLAEAQGQSPWNRFDQSRIARNPFGSLVVISRRTSKNFFSHGAPQIGSWISCSGSSTTTHSLVHSRRVQLPN